MMAATPLELLALWKGGGYVSRLYHCCSSSVTLPFSRTGDQRVPEALKHYQNEFFKFYTVLENVFKEKEEHGQALWLVGDRCTVADLTYVMSV